MNLHLSNRQNLLQIDLPKLKALSQWLLHHAENHNPQRRWNGFSLVLVDDPGMIPINQHAFDRSTPTDVISFAYPPLPHENGWSGEVILNAQRAREEGSARNDIPREFALYLAHGIDHLTGADDATPQQRTTMHQRENQWLDHATTTGLLTPDLVSIPHRN